MVRDPGAESMELPALAAIEPSDGRGILVHKSCQSRRINFVQFCSPQAVFIMWTKLTNVVRLPSASGQHALLPDSNSRRPEIIPRRSVRRFLEKIRADGHLAFAGR